MAQDDKKRLFNDLKKRLSTAGEFFSSDQNLQAISRAELPGLHNYPEPAVPENLRYKVDSLKSAVKAVEKQARYGLKSDFDQGRKYKIDYRKELNDAQFLAATKLHGPVLVIAGAGSGKTRAIVYRVSFLLENGVDPERILLLTFTRKAAHEMLRRVGKLTGSRSSSKVMGGTFHSFASAMLRRFGRQIGIEPNFTIIDSADAADAINLVRGQLGIRKGKGSLFPNKNQLQAIISAARNKSKSIAEILESEHPRLVDHQAAINAIARAYKDYKRRANVFDYDDLLEVLKDKLTADASFRRQIQGLFDYILVDEYQDTNLVQSQLLKLIVDRRRNIFAVGDDAQSIYAFRGANFENILRFPREFAGASIILMEDNYRSNQEILDFANAVINQAYLGYQKNLQAQISAGRQPQALKFYDEQAEAKFIADVIEADHQKGTKLRNLAVLYRSSYQGDFVQAELLKRGIPFMTFGGIKFIERRHVKDVMAYLRLSVNSDDSLAWSRILTLLPGLGEASASRIINDIQQRQFQPAQHAGRPYAKELAELVEALAAVRQAPQPAAKMDIIFRHYYPYLESNEEDADIRKLDLLALKKLAEGYASIESFINDFSLDPPNQAFQDKEIIDGDEVDDFVTLSTVHSAKGLEWQTVFIVHALEGLFPSHRSVRTVDELDEERRLFYVAATRAKDRLYVTMPSYSAAYEAFFSLPSRFIVEAAQTGEVVDFQASAGHGRRNLGLTIPETSSAEPRYVPELNEGDGVRHQQFGIGTVVELAGDTATINFQEHGTKQINLSFAPIEKI